LAGDAVRVSGLGIFNVAARPAREGQTMRLTEAGAIKVFGDVRSGRTMERPGLEALLAYARDGDTLAVVRLDRLGRSLGELLTTVAMLKERGIALLSLEERIDTNSAAGELVFHVFGAIAHFGMIGQFATELDERHILQAFDPSARIHSDNSSQYRPSPLPRRKRRSENLADAQIHRPRESGRSRASDWPPGPVAHPCSPCFIRSRSGIATSYNDNPAPTRGADARIDIVLLWQFYGCRHRKPEARCTRVSRRRGTPGAPSD
jgi:hypothetical protein